MSPSPNLHPNHYRTIAALGDGMIEARGYYTETDPAAIERLGFGPDSARVPALVVPLWGVDGDVIGHQIRPDEPRVIDERVLKYETLPGWGLRIDVPPIPEVQCGLADPSRTLWITEGCKKADSAAIRGLVCIALLGVWGWRGRHPQTGGILELADWDRIAIRDRHIVLAFDSDVVRKPQVRQALRRLARMLRRRGARRVEAVLMPEPQGSKVGLDDWFAAGGDVRGLLETTDNDILGADGIQINNRGLDEVGADAIEALIDANEPVSLLSRAGRLVRVVPRDDDVTIQPVLPAALRGMLADATRWYRATEKGSIYVYPPTDVAEYVYHRPALGIPQLDGIRTCPIVRDDGSIASTSGYDHASRYWIDCPTIQIPADPDPESAAAWIVEELLWDFPFCSASDAAHAIGLMILPMVRHLVRGSTPIHLIEAPTQGSGKSLLARVALGACIQTVSSAPAPTQEDEWRKRLTSSLMAGSQAIFLDNLEGRVASPALAAAVTAWPYWSDRLLGSTQEVELPASVVWVATGNNVTLSRDLARRALRIRIDPRIEVPDQRPTEMFRRPDLESFVRRHRADILERLVAMVSATASGQRQGPVLGGFEAWSSMIGGILESCGVPGFLANLRELRAAANPEEDALGEFYDLWYSVHGSEPVRAGALVEYFESEEVLVPLIHAKDEASKAVRLGLILKQQRDVVRRGLTVQLQRNSHLKSGLYALVPVPESRIPNPESSAPNPESRILSPLGRRMAERWGLATAEEVIL